MANFPAAFAQDPAEHRLPNAIEKSQGFQCGPAEKELFNKLFNQIHAELGEVISFAGITGTDNRDTLVREAIEKIAQLQIVEFVYPSYIVTNGTQTVPNSVLTDMQGFSAPNNSLIDSTVSDAEVTIGAQDAGKYFVASSAVTASASPGSRFYTELRVGGQLLARDRNNVGTIAAAMGATVGTFVNLNQGTVISGHVFQTSGGDLSITGGRFSMVRIGS